MGALRANELFRKIVHVDPELLLPYLLERRGRTQDGLLAGARGRRSREGQRDGSVRDGDPALLARSVLLTAHGFLLSGDHDDGPSPRPSAAFDGELQRPRRRATSARERPPWTPYAGARELSEATDGRVVDLLVVGLGVTGAGVALDAASRGLSVVAVDAHDLAFGTSRWSSKLVHGGLRYLANGQVGVAHESAVERGVLMTRTAPHLTRALPMLIPLLPTTTHHAGPASRGPACSRATCCAPRPAPAARCCPGRAGCPAPRPSRSPPGCAPPGSAAGCCRGTASSRTTPAWSPASPAPPPRAAPASSRAPGSCT